MIKTYGLATCNHCGQMFIKYNWAEKYCCFHCAELGKKQSGINRQHRYLATEHGRTKHLIRLKSYYRMRAEQPTVCECCGKIGKLHFHHVIYADEYLTVGRWLCPKCHKQQHMRIEDVTTLDV